MAITDTERASRLAAPSELFSTVVRAIVFTDVVGSTEVASHHGDLEMLRLLARHDGIVERIIAPSSSGEIVKSTGDGAMVAFALPKLAFTAALEIQRRALDEQVPLRIGIHYGPVTRCRDTDYRGLVVNIAARLCDLSATGEILLTEQAARAAQLAERADARAIRGVADSVAVCSVGPSGW